MAARLASRAVRPAAAPERVLVVGGGPAGLECARVLAQRGHEVTLAEAGTEFGGRLRFETRLPGLAAWSRVLDYRLAALRVAPNVQLCLDSRLAEHDVLAFGCDRVVIATGSRWTKALYSPLELAAGSLDRPDVLTPDDIAAGAEIEGPVVVFDFDNYVMGGLVAQYLAGRGHDVSYVTPAGHPSAWTLMTNELPRVLRTLADHRIDTATMEMVTGFDGSTLTLHNVFTEAATWLSCRSLVVVGLRAAEELALPGAGRPVGRLRRRRNPLGHADRRRAGAGRAGSRRLFRACLWPRVRPGATALAARPAAGRLRHFRAPAGMTGLRAAARSATRTPVMKHYAPKYRRESPETRREGLVEAAIRCLARDGHEGVWSAASPPRPVSRSG